MLHKMRPLMLVALVSGCATANLGSVDRAICEGTRKARTEHAEALVDDGGDRSVVTGAALIAQIDAGCASR